MQMLESKWFKETFRDEIEGIRPRQQTPSAGVLVGSELSPSASRLLLAFMGAAHGSFFSVSSFVEEAFLAYR